MTTKTCTTAQDLWRLGEGDTRRELVNGEIVETTPVGGIHGRITSRIARRLAEHVERHGGGEVVVGDVGFVLTLPHDPERVRAPDAAFIATSGFRRVASLRALCPGRPSWRWRYCPRRTIPWTFSKRCGSHLDGGARLVWIIAPAAKTATIYRADGSARLLREVEHLDGEDVCRGWASHWPRSSDSPLISRRGGRARQREASITRVMRRGSGSASRRPSSPRGKMTTEAVKSTPSASSQ
jgi:Uma2 family endonuclease